MARKKQEIINPPKLLASAENLVGMPDGSRQTINSRGNIVNNIKAET
jgi:hypothetical protein